MHVLGDIENAHLFGGYSHLNLHNSETGIFYETYIYILLKFVNKNIILPKTKIKRINLFLVCLFFVFPEQPSEMPVFRGILKTRIY